MKELEQPKPNQQIASHVVAPPALPSPELFQKRWFCVGLYPSGKTFKQDAESPIAFSGCYEPLVVPGWTISRMTRQRYLPVVAAQMGFSEAFIASISGETTLNYQDFDNEMWMRLPFHPDPRDRCKSLSPVYVDS